jgi:WD40 repeat protein
MADRAILKSVSKLIVFLCALAFMFLVRPQELYCSGEEKILFHSFEVDGPSIYCINPDGTGLKKIVKKGVYPVLSPDRSKFAYLAPAGTNKDIVKNRSIISISDCNGNVFSTINPMIAKVAGIEEYDLPGYYEWCPSGKKLAIVSIFLQNDVILRIFDLEKENIQEIYKTKVKNFDLAYLWSFIEWINDNKLLFYNGSPAGDEVRASVIDSGIKSILQFKHETLLLRYWPGKGFLVFSPSEKGTDLLVLDDRGDKTEPFLFLDKILAPASKVSNSNLLLYGGQQGDINRKLYNLSLIKKQIEAIDTPKKFNCFSSELSPDGNKFICVGAKDAEQEAGYYLFEIRTKKLTLLYKFPTKMDSSYWKSIYFGKTLKDYSWK